MVIVNNNNIAQHFRPDELEFIEQVQSWLKVALDEYRPVLSQFLNPRQQRIATTVVNREATVNHRYYGGQNAEMQRLLIYPSYYEPEVADFEISLLQIDYPTKFAILKHNQILGSLMGLGLTRNTFGDVVNAGDTWQFFVNKDMASYVITNLTKIDKIKIHLHPVALSLAVRNEDEWENTTITVSSLRLDVLISETFNLSRSRVKQMVEAGNVKLNWAEIFKPDYSITLDDWISVRHFGRIRLVEVLGTTKKEKLRVNINKIENSKK